MRPCPTPANRRAAAPARHPLHARRSTGQTPVMITASLSSGWIEGIVTDDRNQPIVRRGGDGAGARPPHHRDRQRRPLPAARHPGRHVSAARPGPRLRRLAPGVRPGGAVARHALRRPAAAGGGAGDGAGRRRRARRRRRPVVDGGRGRRLDRRRACCRSRSEPRPPTRCRTITRRRRGACGMPSARSSARRRRASTTSRSSTTRICGARSDASTLAGWTAGVGRSAASAVLNGALTGRVQLLTAGAFDQPFEAFTTDDMPAGIAFVHLAGPLSTRTTWSVEAATARGGVTSWFVGGTYATVVADSHGVEVHSSYSRQRSGGGQRRQRLRPRGRRPQRRRRAGGRSLDDRAARDARRRRPLRALRLPARSRAVQPDDHGVAVAGGAHVGARHRGARDERARRRGVRAAGLRLAVAAAAADLLGDGRRPAARRPGDAAPRRRARAGHRHVPGRGHALPPERRRPARHGVRPEPGQGAAARRPQPLRRRQRRRLRRQRLGRRRQPPGRDAPARRGGVPHVGRRLAGRRPDRRGGPGRPVGGAVR